MFRQFKKPRGEMNLRPRYTQILKDMSVQKYLQQ